MLRLAAWHEFQSKEYMLAADEPWGPIPHSQPGPPMGWIPLAREEIPNR